jgi:hypothetical protein
VPAAQLSELVAGDHERLRALDAQDRGRPVRLGREHGQLAEHLPRSEHRQGEDVPRRGGHLDGHVAPVEEVEAVPSFALPEDGLVPPVPASGGSGQHAPPVLLSEGPQEGPLHAVSVAGRTTAVLAGRVSRADAAGADGSG